MITRTILGIFLTVWLISSATSYSHIENDNNAKRKWIDKRLLVTDKSLTALEPATKKVPLINQGLPPLSSLLINNTVTRACQQLEKVKSKGADVLYVGALGYTASVEHYMSSSSALPSCVFRPATSNDVILALHLIEEERISFSVNGGKHTGNPKFSSTDGGLQIDMRKFSQVTLSKDESYVDIGPGNVWENVYGVLEKKGKMVKGGRVSGVGVGGLMTGGGGYSFFTQKYGMACDSIESIDIVVPNPARKITISAQSLPDLFWAVKGGGNQFGIVTNFRVKTFSIPSKIWGGTRIYLGHDEIFKNFSLQFAQSNHNVNASASMEFLYYAKLPIYAIHAFYDDAQPPPGIFDGLMNETKVKPVQDTWGPTTITEIVKSAPSNVTIGLRGYFHVASIQHYTRTIFDVALKEIDKLNNDPLHSGFYFHVAIVPAGKNYGEYANQTNSSPFPFYKSPQSMEFYFGWVNPLDDNFYHQAIKNIVKLVQRQARAEGQQIDDLPLYPNYAIFDTPAMKLFGPENLARLRKIKERYDPRETMRLTTWFPF